MHIHKSFSILIISFFVLGTLSLEAQTDFPFFDDMEDQTQSESYWTADEGWSNVSNINAYSGSRIWQYSYDDEIKYLTLTESMDLSGEDAINPKLSFWVRSSASYCYLYLSVSTDGGSNWITLLNGIAFSQTTWTNYQYMLNDYRSDNFKVRIGATSSSSNFWLDDVRIDNAPNPQSITLSNAGNNSMSLTWSEDGSSDFAYYTVVLTTNQSDMNTFPGNVNSNTYNHRHEKRIFTVMDQSELTKTFNKTNGNALRFVNTTYYAKIWCVDDQGLYNQGSEIENKNTTYNMDTENAPKTQDFDGTPEPQWAGDLNWTKTDSQNGVAGHSSPNCLESNPSSNYEGNSDRHLTSKWTIPYSMTRPVLTFNHRYSFASGDVAYLEYSLDGSNWYRIEQYSGSAIAGWQSQEFDVSFFKQNSSGQPIYIRYKMDIDGDGNQSTGWMLDDVAINQNQRNEVSFPFYDNFEDTEQSEENWILSNWTNIETANPHGGLRAIKSNGTTGSGGNSTSTISWIYLGSPIDLSNAANPYLSLWSRSDWNSSNDPHIYISVSYDGGLTWNNILDEQVREPIWQRFQVSLNNKPDARIRIGTERNYSHFYGYAPQLWVDDVYIGDQPYLLYPQYQSDNKPLCLTFLWRGTGSSAQFHLMVGDNSDFSSPVINENSLTGDNYYSCGDLEENTRYYWKLKGLNPETNWTSTYYFDTGTDTYEQLSAPSPQTPENGEDGVSTSPTFTWSSVTEADHYQLQLSISPVFDPLYFDGTTTGTSHQLTGLEFGGSYYWRVKAVNDDSESPFSIPWIFSVGGNITTLEITAPLQGYWDNEEHGHASAIVELWTGEELSTATFAYETACLYNSDGVLTANFNNLTEGYYWIIIRATGHVPVSSASSVFVAGNMTTEYDFTTSANQAYGTGATVLKNGIYVIRGGDLNGDGNVTASDLNNDFIPNFGQFNPGEVPSR